MHTQPTQQCIQQCLMYSRESIEAMLYSVVLYRIVELRFTSKQFECKILTGNSKRSEKLTNGVRLPKRDVRVYHCACMCVYECECVCFVSFNSY